MEITARNLARLIELDKKKAELEFQRDILKLQPGRELAQAAASAEGIREMAAAAGIEIIFPNQKKLDELGKVLSNFTPEAIRESIKAKDGPPYQMLMERGAIVKKNFENRLEVAKLSIIMSWMSAAEKKAVANVVALGLLEHPLKIESLNEEKLNKLALFMRRCGIKCKLVGNELRPAAEEESNEVQMQVASRSVWIKKDAKAELEENLRKMRDISAHIQLKNAERQIKVFSREEEEHFAALQREYLNLLKQQDELLKEFNAEERLTIKPHDQ